MASPSRLRPVTIKRTLSYLKVVLERVRKSSEMNTKTRNHHNQSRAIEIWLLWIVDGSRT
jgi:hypothetical protein